MIFDMSKEITKTTRKIAAIHGCPDGISRHNSFVRTELLNLLILYGKKLYGSIKS